MDWITGYTKQPVWDHLKHTVYKIRRENIEELKNGITVETRIEEHIFWQTSLC